MSTLPITNISPCPLPVHENRKVENNCYRTSSSVKVLRFCAMCCKSHPGVNSLCVSTTLVLGVHKLVSLRMTWAYNTVGQYDVCHNCSWPFGQGCNLCNFVFSLYVVMRFIGWFTLNYPNRFLVNIFRSTVICCITSFRQIVIDKHHSTSSMN